MFFIFFFSVLAMVYGYAGWRVIPYLTPDLYFRTICALVWITSFSCNALYFFFKFHQKSSWSIDAMAWIGFTSLGLASLLFSFFLIKDIGHLAVAAVLKIIQWSGSSPVSELPQNPERRKFILGSVHLGLAGIAALLTGYGFYKATLIPRVKKVRLKLGHLHPQLTKLKMVQITDLHLGPTIKSRFIREVVDKINALSPDIVAITGDLVDGTVEELKGSVSELRRLRSRYGVYFVTGNHEYYSGVEPWIRHLRRQGITVLMNEHRMLLKRGARILLAGVTDYSAPPGRHQSNPRKALAGAPEAHVKILLAHQPKSAFKASEAGFDLQLSGHTHGGQYFPSTWLIKLFEPFVAGLYTHKNMQLYVSKGTGYWGPPLRLQADSEITEFEIV